ncbi:DUF2871 domain-containing protein [Longibaculum muris]|uniref:DUF2871 domain-containing protein n=1 Tax=Longibaculum muris TaxID=1796628 RepID=UPI0022E2172B|nr:DUF2871 domain-containing protein [Longibaculum muris]
MKKMIRIAFFYVILALIGGVFYREFTKFNGFTGVTVLADVHVHLMVLGVFMFMILALFVKNLPLLKEKRFSQFMVIYNIGLLLTVIMMVIRGMTQVLTMTLTSGMSAAISGIAGIGHVLLGIGLILLMITLLKTTQEDA